MAVPPRAHYFSCSGPRGYSSAPAPAVARVFVVALLFLYKARHTLYSKVAETRIDAISPRQGHRPPTAGFFYRYASGSWLDRNRRLHYDGESSYTPMYRFPDRFLVVTGHLNDVRQGARHEGNGLASFQNFNTALGFCLLVLCAGFLTLNTPRVGEQPDGSYIIPTGQILTPAGRHIEVNDRPLGMALSPDGRYMVVTTGSNFAPRRIHVIDVTTQSISQTISIGDSFVGVVFSSDGGTLYVGGGRDNNVKIFRRDDQGHFHADGDVMIAGSAPSGLSLSPDDATLYVVLNLRHAVAVIDTQTLSVRQVPVGSYPYTTVVTPDGAKVYVSNWGGRTPGPDDVTDGLTPVVVDPETGIPNNGTVSVIDATGLNVIQEIEVGVHPSAMVFNPDGSRLYVANANTDTLSVIDTTMDTVERTIDVRLFEGAPLGSAPNALAFSPDGRTLYVANGANNAVAVVEPDRVDAPVRGFIPTGWFPTAVALTASGDELYVASGYGFGSVAPASGRGRRYSDRKGVVSILSIPDAKSLAAYTEQVMRNNRAPSGADSTVHSVRAARPSTSPVPMNRSQGSPIKYVFYIIKENRTYDQVFGDLPQGDGDSSLVQFGRNVTPNHHALADRFVLLDNFYATGDQSSLGHQWCNEAYANDFVHKYGNARDVSEGTYAMGYGPSGFIWDHARWHGKTVRVYGEYAQTAVTPLSATWSDIYNDWRNGGGRITFQSTVRIAGLRGIIHPRFPAFVMKIPDQIRADMFIEELRNFEKNGGLPDLLVIYLPADHTNGTAPRFPTPRAMVADNDLALGRVVEAISKSRFWPQSAIFVTEDDAQNGLDHIDGHRTVGMVLGPYARRRAVDRTLYTTVNMFRTIEQVLGLPPLNPFDLAAEPMFGAFTETPDFAGYTALPNQVPLDEMNPGLAGLIGLQKELAEASMRMDFSEPDEVPQDLLNRVIWHSVKGYNVPYPSVRHLQR